LQNDIWQQLLFLISGIVFPMLTAGER
jgi:hypothetical protein